MKKAAHNRVELAGQRFGRLIVLAYSHTNHNRKAFWNCQCDCGKRSAVMGMRLISGHTTSCGCKQDEVWARHLLKRWKHGGVGTSTYQSWDNAKHRCFSPSDDHYLQYGGAGVTMCARWLYSFPSFLQDMGERPVGKTIDRYPNPTGNYEPGNCRWATPKEQARNRRHNRIVDFGGWELPLVEAVEKFGVVKYDTVAHRLKRGWHPEAAIMTPAGQQPAPCEWQETFDRIFSSRAAERITVVS